MKIPLFFEISFVLFLSQQISALEEPMQEFTAASNRFTLDFFRLAYHQEPNENLILSPVSFHASLSMFSLVANSNVSGSIRTGLGLPTDIVAIVRSIHAFLTNSNNEALRIASKVYYGQHATNQNFIQLLRNRFGAEPEEVDFHQPHQIVDSANDWVDRVTDGMVKEFLDPKNIETDDNLMLLNAVFLNASWYSPFNTEYTRKAVFHFTNGNHEIEMMFQSDDFRYAKVADLHILVLPYEDHQDLEMMIILPHNGSLEETVDGFTAELYQSLDNALEEVQVIVSIPKFSVNKTTDASSILRSMGLSSIFDEGVFSVFQQETSKLSKIRQSAKIEITEAGTSAAAVTEMRFMLMSAPFRTVIFTADHPFLYLIRKKSTKSIFFIGHYSHYEL